MAGTTTIEIDKGDITGAVLAAIPGVIGLMIIGTVYVSCMMGEVRLKDFPIPLMALGILSLVGWGLWEFGHAWMA